MPLLYALTIIFGIQFAVLHILAELFSLYWRYPWLDIPMHLFGGMFLIMAVATLAEMRIAPSWLSSRFSIVVLLGGVLLLWEVFGIYRYGGLKPGFLSDTLLDIVCGVGGLVLGYVFVRGLRRMV